MSNKHNIANSQSSSYSRPQQETPLSSSGKVDLHREQNTHFSETRSSNISHFPQNSYFSQHHATSSVEMMEQLLQGATISNREEMVTSSDKEKWGELLTNKYKMENYKMYLTRQINKGKESGPHLKLLLFLLDQIEKSSVQVHYGNHLQLEFNAGQIKRQSQEITELRQEKKRTEEELQEVSKEYEKILFNFNAVIENLMQKDPQSSHK